MEEAATFSAGIFRLATEVRYGEGVAMELGDALGEVGASRVLVVTDRGVRAAGIVDRLLATVPAAIDREVWDGVHPNPRDSDCLDGAEAARAFDADLIVAIGGGSPIDAAKAIAALATNGGTPADWATPRTAADCGADNRWHRQRGHPLVGDHRYDAPVQADGEGPADGAARCVGRSGADL
jgi:alcohol dehydrogenase class IV